MTGSAAEAVGGGEFADQEVALACELLGSAGVVPLLRFSELGVQLGEPGAVYGPWTS